jgi:hypothetical protein
MEDKLVEILNSLHQAVAKTSDFALDQLPDVVNSYLLYARVLETLESLVWACVFVLMLWLLVKKVIYNKQWVERIPYTQDTAWPVERGLSLVFCAACLVISFLLCFFQLKDFFLVWLAPKVYLLMAISNLIK